MKNKKLPHLTSSGFKAPDHYLESFDELLLTKLRKDRSLKNLQNSGFKVPDRYFETFDNRVIKTMSSEKEAKVISLFSWKNAAYISGVAASLILMVSLFNNYNQTPTFGNLETALIEDYIEGEDFTNEDIASLVTEDLTMDKFMDSHLINDSNLEDYILDNASVEDYLKE